MKLRRYNKKPPYRFCRVCDCKVFDNRWYYEKHKKSR